MPTHKGWKTLGFPSHNLDTAGETSPPVQRSNSSPEQISPESPEPALLGGAQLKPGSDPLHLSGQADGRTKGYKPSPKTPVASAGKLVSARAPRGGQRGSMHVENPRLPAKQQRLALCPAWWQRVTPRHQWLESDAVQDLTPMLYLSPGTASAAPGKQRQPASAKLWGLEEAAQPPGGGSDALGSPSVAVPQSGDGRRSDVEIFIGFGELYKWIDLLSMPIELYWNMECKQMFQIETLQPYKKLTISTMPQKEILCSGAGGKTLSPASRFECHQNHLMKSHTEQVEEATVNCGAIKPSRDLMKEPTRRTPHPPQQDRHPGTQPTADGVKSPRGVRSPGPAAAQPPPHRPCRSLLILPLPRVLLPGLLSTPLSCGTGWNRSRAVPWHQFSRELRHEGRGCTPITRNLATLTLLSSVGKPG